MPDLLHPLPDAAERSRAASEFGTSFIVLAGAGTGKTSLLVERLLTAIGGGRLEIGEIAAITFTEKASGEMRQRLADGLEQLRRLAVNEPVTDKDTEARRAHGHLTGEEGHNPGQIAAHALAALEQLDHATVQTIHAFCAELLRRYPLEAGVEPDFTVDTGEYEARLREPAWNEFITYELGPEAPRPELWRRLLAVFGIDDLRRAAFALAGFHIPDRLLELPFDPPPVDELFADRAGALAESVEALLSRAQGMTPRTSAYFNSVARALRVLIDQGLEEFKTQVAVSDELGPRIEANKAAPKANKKLEGVAPEMLDQLSRQSLRFVRNLSRTDDATLLELLEGLAPFALDFRERLLTGGFVSFDGLLALARDLLRDHPDVRREIKRRYKALLVDEFQDTDPLQYEIVLFLAEQPGSEAADPYSTKLERGRLFIVGDAKQSIYRFRGADYAAYRAAIDRVLQEDGQQLILSANFRSEAGLLEPVNRVFSAEDGVWKSSDYQPEYVPIQAARDGEAPPPNVEVWTVELGDDRTADRRREAEGQVLAREIERLVCEQQACRYKEISILLRAFTQLSQFVRPLRERGIPFIVDGGKEFMKRPEVAQLLAVLRALSQPSDSAALLAFLRSPAGGVPDTDLTEYARAGGRWSWQSEVDESRFGLIAGRFELLRGLAREMRDLPADAVIRRVVEATCLLPLNAVAFEGAQRVANLSKLAAAAGELARDGKLSLEEVAEALLEGGLSNFEADSPLADDADDAVRICTIHKMKGLENRIVFLPDLAREDRPARSETLDVGAVRLPGGGQSLALKVGKFANSILVWKDEEDRLHEDAEEIRVLYVAMTRAKQRLIVVAGQSRRDSRGIEALRAWGYSVDDPPADGATLVDGSVLHRRIIPEAPSRQPADVTPPSAERAVGAYESAVEKLTAAAAPVFRSPSGSREESELALRPPERESALRPAADRRDLGMAVGILLHRWLEQWNGNDGEDLRDSFRALCRAVATVEDVDPQELEREGRMILEEFLAGPLAQRFRGVTHMGRELPVLLRDPSGAIYRGSIDLLYRDEAGDPIIADYKTDRETDESALRERYREQLRIYAVAVRQALDLPRLPRAELWSLRTGHRIAINWNENPSR